MFSLFAYLSGAFGDISILFIYRKKYEQYNDVSVFLKLLKTASV